MRVSVCAALGLLSVLGCSDDPAPAGPLRRDDQPGATDDGGAPTANACEGVAPLALEVSASRARSGTNVVLTGKGGSGSYTFEVAASGSGGKVNGTSFVPGPTPAVDQVTVTDAKCGGSASTSITVVAPFRVSPRTATVRPSTSFAIQVDGVLGKPVFELVSSTAASTLDANGTYTAGANDGTDTLRVHDDVGGDEAMIHVDVRAGTELVASYPRLALPPGSSVPLRTTGGSDTVAWKVVSGPGTAVGGRFAAAANDPTPSHLLGEDVFTKDVVEIDVTPLGVVLPAGQASDGLGSSVALVPKGTGTLAAFGAPSFQAGFGRAYTFDTASSTSAATIEGAATPIHRGRRVGAGVTFSDFNGDGRPDLVAAAPELVLPTIAVRDTEVTPFYATERAACVQQTSNSKGGILVSIGRADGTFAPAYRLWHDVAGQGDLGLDVAGGFDFNGDGRADIAATRTGGLEIFLGRPADDGTLAKLTMGCDPALTLSGLPAPIVSVAAIRDVNGDGCDDVAVGYHDATHGGVVVTFGFDVSGVRCGGRTTPSSVQISADADTGETYFGLGTAVANVGKFRNDATSWLAVGATKLPFTGGARAGVMLLDLAKVTALRPASGIAAKGLATSGVTTNLVGSVDVLDGLGSALVGGVDVTGDGIVDLVAGAPAASFAANGSGVALVFAGGAASTGELRPWALVAGDDGSTAAGLGRALSLFPAGGSRPAMLGIGSPTSARSGPGNGAAFLLSFP